MPALVAIHHAVSLAITVTPPITFSSTLAITVAVAGRNTSIREPNFMTPNLSPAFTTSPSLMRQTMRRAREGDEVQAGDRFGVMKFGSRMDVFVPKGTEITVKVGDRVVGAVTVIAVLP